MYASNYIEIIPLLYLQAAVISAIWRAFSRTAARTASLFLVNATGGRPIAGEKRGASERTGSSRSSREECGVDGTNGGSSEGKQNSTHDSHVVTAPLRSVVRKLGSTSSISDDCPRLAFYSFIRRRVSTRDHRNSTEGWMLDESGEIRPLSGRMEGRAGERRGQGHVQ